VYVIYLQVAVKIFKKAAGSERAHLKLWMKEVKAMKRLSHPNVIQFIDSVDDHGVFCVVMEYCSGGNLLEYVIEHKYLYEGEAKKFFRQIAHAVEHCHLNGVVHRDLKCENLMLDRNKNIKICDFGFAAVVTDADESLSAMCGTYAYAAPEILNNLSYIGSQADVWSIGVILHIMTVGKLPFDGKDMGTALDQMKLPLQTPKRLSTKCSSLLGKILQPDTGKRATISEIIDDKWMLEKRVSRARTHSNSSVKSTDADALSIRELMLHAQESNRVSTADSQQSTRSLKKDRPARPMHPSFAQNVRPARPVHPSFKKQGVNLVEEMIIPTRPTVYKQRVNKKSVVLSDLSDSVYASSTSSLLPPIAKRQQSM
jgi:serine/threonine protein kinase